MKSLPSHRLLDRAAAAKDAQVRRERGERIVFTNGCFDLLHPGHVIYLEEARALGDCLFLGLNTDASVRRLKGPSRPILSEASRAIILGALRSVDQIVLFDEPTPLDLIEKIRPDILCKGGDYRPDDVVGKSEVEQYGGRVEILAFHPGYSTTDIVAKIEGQIFPEA